jgi:hypothetical protein
MVPFPPVLLETLRGGANTKIRINHWPGEGVLEWYLEIGAMLFQDENGHYIMASRNGTKTVKYCVVSI